MPLLNILLPICVEIVDVDVFLHIVRSITSRKCEDHYSVSAFKCGMSSEPFPIEQEDLTLNWDTLNSPEQRIRQMKLIGCWAAHNFPSLGIKLLGLDWVPSERSCVFIDNQEIDVDTINSAVSRKMEMRIIELNLSDGTVSRLKEFVRVPPGIGRLNETKISKQTKSFEVEERWLEACWKALNVGKFEDQLQSGTSVDSSPIRQDGQQFVIGDNDSVTSAIKRTHQDIIDANDDTNVSNDGDASNTNGLSVPIPKRVHIEAPECVLETETNRNGHSVMGELHQSSTNGSEYSSMSIIQASLLDIRNAIVTMKDDQIANLKETVRDLRQINVSVSGCQSKSTKQIEEQSLLINALRQERDESELQRISSVREVDELKRQLAESMATVACMKSKISQSQEVDQKLREEVSYSKKCSDDLRAEFAKQIESLQFQLKASTSERDESERLRVSMTNELNRQLAESMASMASVTSERDESERQRVSLVSKTHELSRQLAESMASVAAMKTEICHWKEVDRKLREEVSGLKKCTEEITAIFQGKIAMLAAGIESAETINSELSRSNEKLQNDLASKEKELEEVYRALSEKASQTSPSNAVECHKIEQIPVEDIDVGKVVICGNQDEVQGCVKPVDAVLPTTINNAIGTAEIEMIAPVCVSDDPIVQVCRPILITKKFGWMKLNEFKNSKYRPGFVYPPDADGVARAQQIKADGYITSRKNIFFDFHEELPEKLKSDAEKSALRKFNEKFKFSFV